MNLLDILSTGELYRIAGYSKKTSKENIHIPYFKDIESGFTIANKKWIE